MIGDASGQRVEMHVWHSSAGLQKPQLLTAGGVQAAFVWAFDSAQFEEDSRTVSNEIIAWSKMIEQTGAKRAASFVVAMCHDVEGFSASLHALENSLRSSLPLPAPTFVLLSHKSNNSASLVRQLCAVGSKRLLAFHPVPAGWVSLAESLAAQHSDEWSVLTLAALGKTAQGYGVEDSQMGNLLRFLHASTSVLWWFEDVPLLQDIVFCNPPSVVAFCLRLVDALRVGVGSDGVLAASVDKLWSKVLAFVFVSVFGGFFLKNTNKELREGLRAPFLRLLVRLELVIEMNGSKWFVPSLQQPSGGSLYPRNHHHHLQQQQSHSLPYCEFVAREYEFVYVPQHFFDHFCVKMFWHGEASVESMSRRGLVLSLQSRGGNNKSERATVTWDNIRYVLNFVIETRRAHASSGFHIHKEQLLRFLTETAESLARGKFRAKFSVKIPCNHCLADPNCRSAPFQFSYQAVVDALTSNARTLPCQGLTSRQVLISSLCPDLALADLSRNQIAANQVELGSELGKGGFATVFKGLWKGREVAVKQMHACHSQEEFSEFQREAWIMGGLRSPYLVKLLGVCLEPPMLVMELLDGSLYSFLHSSTAPIDKRLRLQIALDIAMGMSVLESSTPQLMHRDLKSPNILMVQGVLDDHKKAPVCKVTDFGLSKQLFGQVAGRDVFNPDWLAPEIILNQPYSMSSDVFSFGIILWELVSRQHPFDEYAARFMGLPDTFKEDAIAKEGLRPTVPPPDRCEVCLFFFSKNSVGCAEIFCSFQNKRRGLLVCCVSAGTLFRRSVRRSRVLLLLCSTARRRRAWRWCCPRCPRPILSRRRSRSSPRKSARRFCPTCACLR
jgi:hypothetical protein